ncbi:MAG: cell division protein ZapA [Fibrobacterota bacterium]
MASLKKFIAGEEFSLRGDAGEEEISMVADFVDKKIREMEKSAPDRIERYQVAIYTALNIAGELFTLRKECEDREAYIDLLKKKVEEVHSKLEEPAI